MQTTSRIRTVWFVTLWRAWPSGEQEWDTERKKERKMQGGSCELQINRHTRARVSLRSLSHHPRVFRYVSAVDIILGGRQRWNCSSEFATLHKTLKKRRPRVFNYLFSWCDCLKIFDSHQQRRKNIELMKITYFTRIINISYVQIDPQYGESVLHRVEFRYCD